MRRFIAGAVCPRCRAVDRIVVEEVPAAPASTAGGSTPRRRCVACGYSDTLAANPSEPVTRFTRAVPQEAPARAVRILERGGDADEPRG